VVESQENFRDFTKGCLAALAFLLSSAALSARAYHPLYVLFKPLQAHLLQHLLAFQGKVG